MYTNDAYNAPNIEIIEVKVEQGFENSIERLPVEEI